MPEPAATHAVSSGSETPGRVAPVEFRAVDQMTEQDRDLEADAESSIGERAGFAGMEFNQGKWSYQQMVCPGAAQPPLPASSRATAATGDVSVFTASIPRGGEGRVRIIPILRRGYSLFSPAPINALTISAFNHIRAEEHPGQGARLAGGTGCAMPRWRERIRQAGAAAEAP